MRPFLLSIVCVLALMASSCHELPDYDNNLRGNFDALWTILDEHYCFFKEKDVDWDEVYERYSSKLQGKMTREDFFWICADMLAELRDGHTNLSAPFCISYYREWWSAYPQNYDQRVIEQYYFGFRYLSLGAYTYGFLPQNIGYIHISTFESGLGAGNIDNILYYFRLAPAMIIDVRDNGGGDLTNVEDLVIHFINERLLAGYIRHKTGPGHDDFSDPMAYWFDPVPSPHIRWLKPVIVLTNRSTFSAANNFVSIMKHLPNVTIVGATTGGGSGMPYSSELPCGWGVRFSACPILDAQLQPTEFGVEPSEGCAVDMDPLAALSGRDTILDFAVGYLAEMLSQ